MYSLVLLYVVTTNMFRYILCRWCLGCLLRLLNKFVSFGLRFDLRLLLDLWLLVCLVCFAVKCYVSYVLLLWACVFG